MEPDVGKLRAVLADSRWLGGTSRAGKSTTARLLADRYGWKVLARDDRIQDHWARASRGAFPAMGKVEKAFGGDGPEWTEFAEGAVADVVEMFWQFTLEDWILTLEDLAASVPELSATDTPLLVEGARLPPQGVAELLSEPRRACRLAPSRTAVAQRVEQGWGWFIERFADPAQGRRRITDIIHGASERLVQSAEHLGLGVARVEATDDPEEVATRVAQVYGV